MFSADLKSACFASSVLLATTPPGLSQPQDLDSTRFGSELHSPGEHDCGALAVQCKLRRVRLRLIQLSAPRSHRKHRS